MVGGVLVANEILVFLKINCQRVHGTDSIVIVMVVDENFVGFVGALNIGIKIIHYLLDLFFLLGIVDPLLFEISIHSGFNAGYFVLFVVDIGRHILIFGVVLRLLTGFKEICSEFICGIRNALTELLDELSLVLIYLPAELLLVLFKLISQSLRALGKFLYFSIGSIDNDSGGIPDTCHFIEALIIILANTLKLLGQYLLGEGINRGQSLELL